MLLGQMSKINAVFQVGGLKTSRATSFFLTLTHTRAQSAENNTSLTLAYSYVPNVLNLI